MLEFHLHPLDWTAAKQGEVGIMNTDLPALPRRFTIDGDIPNSREELNHRLIEVLPAE